MAPRGRASSKGGLRERAAQHGFERWTEWGPLNTDVDFKVKGEEGWFHFQALVRNTRTEETWIDAFGGRHGWERSRSFPTDRIQFRANNKPVTRPHRRRDIEAPGDDDGLELGVVTGSSSGGGGGKRSTGTWMVVANGAVVHTASTRKGARGYVDEHVEGRVKREVIRSGLVQLTSAVNDSVSFLLGLATELAAEGVDVGEAAQDLETE